MSAPGRAPWRLAVAAGVVLGATQTLWIMLTPLAPQRMSFGLIVVFVARWVPLFVVLCCALLWATRSFHARVGAGRPREQFVWTVGVVVLAALLADPLLSSMSRPLRHALALPPLVPWNSFSAGEVLVAIWSRSVPAAALLATMGVCVDRYLEGARRSAQALAGAQLRLAGAQRRLLDEQLRSMQAQVDPVFLFDTLAQIEDSFDSPRAQRLLDALIRYLRAVQQGVGESTSTLGRQAELVRARLEIESERTPGRLRVRVDVPEALCSLRLEPLLVPPLVAWAVERAAGAAAQIAVRFARREGAIVVEVVDDLDAVPLDDPPPTVVAEVGQRLHALYGERAALSVTPASPRGTIVRLDIPLPNP